MQSCPTCRLHLESVDWHGIKALACRSCGGVWLRAADIPVALAERRSDLAELNALYPGGGTTDSFAGLNAPCPDCFTALVIQPLTLVQSELARTCPSCGGIWLDPDTRSRLAEAHVPPLDAEEISQPSSVIGQELVLESDPAIAPPIDFLTTPESSDPRDPILAANDAYVSSFRYGHMEREPRRRIAVLTCMDARMRVYEMLGLEAGDLNVIRNAGGIVTEDTLRSLILSHHLLGTQEFYVINHTDCGLLTITDEGFRAKLVASTGASSAIPATFHPIKDLRENVREQLRRLRSHPWIPASIRIRGFIYDVRTGSLDEVTLP